MLPPASNSVLRMVPRTSSSPVSARDSLARLGQTIAWEEQGSFADNRRSAQLLGTEYGPTSVSRRRLANLAVFLVVGTIASAIGFIPWQVPALLVPWMLFVWLATVAIQRTTSRRAEQWIETVSYCLDALWLTVVCFYLGGADWIAGAFYVLLVITAAASLPMANAAVVASMAWLGFAALALGEASGFITLPQFGPVTSGIPPLSFALLTVVIQGTTLLLAVLLQQALLGALQKSEARHRAILNAASDMVVVLDGGGTIKGASDLFAERTAFPIRDLVGSCFSDIVDAQHLDKWTKALRDAGLGRNAPFEIAYRSTYANQGWIAGTLVPLPEEKGEARVLMIARDVSAERAKRGVGA